MREPRSACMFSCGVPGPRVGSRWAGTRRERWLAFISASPLTSPRRDGWVGCSPGPRSSRVARGAPSLLFVCLLRDRGRLDLAEGAWPVLVMLRGAWPVRTSHRAGAEREHSRAFNANRRAHLPAGVLIGRRESGGSRGFVSLLSLWSRQVACRDGVSMVPHP